MSTAIRWPHLQAVHLPHPIEWSVTLAAALVGAAICAPLAMFAFASSLWVVFIGLLGAAIGVVAAVLACEESVEERT